MTVHPTLIMWPKYWADMSIQLFVCDTQFYFPHSSPLHHKSHRQTHDHTVCYSTVVEHLAYTAGDQRLIPMEVILLSITMLEVALGSISKPVSHVCQLF